MKKEIFRKGDRVFDIRYGWGKVGYVSKDGEITVNFKKHEKYVTRVYNPGGKLYTEDEHPMLSFTEYTLQGFSQERPIDYNVYIGKWGKFWNMENKEDMVIKKLYKHIPDTTNLRFQCLIGRVSMCYKNFEPLTDEQVKILGLE